MNVGSKQQKFKRVIDIGEWTPLDPDVHRLERLDVTDPQKVVARLQQLRQKPTEEEHRQSRPSMQLMKTSTWKDSLRRISSGY